MTVSRFGFLLQPVEMLQPVSDDKEDIIIMQAAIFISQVKYIGVDVAYQPVVL